MILEKIQSKILLLSEAKKWRSEIALAGKKLVMTNGCFDILHKGHITYLAKARELGDFLILAINSDSSVRELKGPARPVTNEADRALILSSLVFIDSVVVFDTKRCDGIISEIKPDIYAKGADYNLQTMDKTEKAVLENIGCRIEFIAFVDGYSTTSIIRKMA